METRDRKNRVISSLPLWVPFNGGFRPLFVMIFINPLHTPLKLIPLKFPGGLVARIPALSPPRPGFDFPVGRCAFAYCCLFCGFAQVALAVEPACLRRRIRRGEFHRRSSLRRRAWQPLEFLLGIHGQKNLVGHPGGAKVGHY